MLYIDDLFKSRRDDRGNPTPPTQEDINLAFEIIDSRYAQRDKLTVISCEYMIDDLLTFDEGIGSRIYQRSKDHCAIIPRDAGKNFRLHGGKV